MVKYAQNELFSITDFTKQIGSAIGSIKEHSLEKIGILKNNKLEAVVISTDEYERLKELEERYELVEHTQIYNQVLERKKTPVAEYVTRSQYASYAHKDLLEQYGIIQSMSRKGNCWDNAVAESFFHTLKTELVYHEVYETKAQANQSIFEYIEVYYNRQRSHSANNNLSPVEFENKMKNKMKKEEMLQLETAA